MSKTVHSVKLIPYDATDLAKLSYSNGDVVYDNTNKTIRVMDGTNQGGWPIATQAWVNSTALTSSNLNTNLSAYVTNTSLTTRLESYVTTSSLTTALNSYVSNSSLTSTLSSYVTNLNLSSSLGSYVTTSTLTNTLSSYAKQSSIPTVPTYTVTTGSASGGGSLSLSGTTFTFNPAATYSLPTASTTQLGGVKVDGTTITISNGVITGANTYSLPVATTSTLGGVKGDGSSVSISGSGVISVPAVATIGAASGIATLDSTGHLTASQIPTSLTGAVVYKGTWSPSPSSGGTPTLANGTGTAGWEYAVTASGTANFGGSNFTFNAGDYVIYNGTIWQQIPTGSSAAAAGTLTGTTLASNVVTSSLTSVGTLTNLTVTNPINGSVTGSAATITGTYGGSLTSTQVTTALGFTPLQSSSLSVTTNTASGSGSLSYSAGVFTFTPAASYTLPAATISSLGGVIPDGTTVTVSSGTISVPTATNSSLGLVRPDGSTITISGGVITSTVSAYTLPAATTSSLGGVEVDGSTITVTGSGQISAVQIPTYGAITTLTVGAVGTSAYTFSQYTGNNPTLYGISGTTLAFKPVAGHPFQIQTSGGTNLTTGLIWVSSTGGVLTGSSAQGQTSGTLYWQIPFGGQGNYKYQCGFHAAMNGVITVVDISTISTS